VTEQQWMKIYRDTVHPLYGYLARRTGGNRELSEDIVQESYLRALDHWNRKAVPNSPLAWLKRVARNILMDSLRQKKKLKDASLDLISSPDQKSSKDQMKSLETFLTISSLGRKTARILEAFYYDGMSVREIAAEMAVSERAVEGRLRRARRSVKSLLPNLTTKNGGKNE
jgi:RNA polymerase sigma-70 factor (ECF subfamily)